MYTTTDYKTGKALKEDFKAGKKIRVYQPGGIFPGTTDGETVVEGPHFPKPHAWWISVVVKDSVIIKINK